jgi:hypothetical protein
MSSEEELMLVPSVAFRYHSPAMELTALAQPSDDWILHAKGYIFILILKFYRNMYFLFILGWYFEDNPFRAMFATSILSATVEGIDGKRVSYFTGSGKQHKPLCIDGLKHEMCTKTDIHGLIEKKFQVSNDDIKQFRVPGGSGGKVEYSVSTPDKTLQTKGEIFLCDDNGISVISDIVRIY